MQYPDQAGRGAFDARAVLVQVTIWGVAALLILIVWHHLLGLIDDDRAHALIAADDNITNLARVSQEHAERTLSSADQTMRLVRSLYLEQEGKLDLKRMVAQGVLDGGILLQLAFIDRHGILEQSSLPFSGRVDLSDRVHFKVHVSSGRDDLFISEPVLGRASGKWSIQLSRRVTRSDGSFGGVFVASLDPTYFTRFYGELKLGGQATATIFGLDGKVRARRRGDRDEFTGDLRTSPIFARLAKGELTGTLAFASVLDGVERTYHYRKLPSYPMVVVMGMANEDVFAGIRERKSALLMQAAIGSALVLALAALCSAYVVSMRLTARARERNLLRLQNLTTRVPGLVYQYKLRPDGSTCFPYASDAIRDIYRVTPEAVRQDAAKVLSVLHPDDYAGVVASVTQSARDLTPWAHDYRVKFDDGTVRWLTGSAVPQRNADGSTLWHGFIFDSTERKRIDAEVERSARLLRGAIEVIDEAFVLYDADDRLVFCNDKYRQIYAKDAHLMVPGVSFETLLRAGARRGQFLDAIGREEEWVAQRLASHIASNSTLIQRHSNGRTLRIVERKLPDGHIVGFRIDITELVQATQAAQEASVAKSRFLATMSHEIRTPMNGILGMAQLLLMPNLSDSERRDYARTILASGQSLLSLLNDILDLSKIESGKFQLDAVVFQPGTLLRETQSLFWGTAQAKNLLLEHRWHGAPGQRYRADSHRLRQMLSNLVGNGIKFTQQGAVRIEGNEISRDPTSAVLEFSVSDSGIGIPPDKLDLLFQPFSQADGSTTRQFGGSGLGLSIVRNLAQAMGGDVGVSSEVGKGSRFWFRVRADVIPESEDGRRSERPSPQGHAVVGAEAEAGATAPASTLRARVMVVEDNPVNCMFIQVLLGKLGVTLTLVHDGQQALDAIMQGDQPDLVLMDLQMPVMDGYAATRHIRQWEADNQWSRLPIIALTADAYDEDRNRCLAAGMDDFLAKPIVVEALKSALAKWLPATTIPKSGPMLPAVTQPLDLPQIIGLVSELTPLLEQNRFGAISRFRKLQDLLAGTELAAEVDELDGLVKELRFDLVLMRLRKMVDTQIDKERS